MNKLVFISLTLLMNIAVNARAAEEILTPLENVTVVSDPFKIELETLIRADAQVTFVIAEIMKSSEQDIFIEGELKHLLPTFSEEQDFWDISKEIVTSPETITELLSIYKPYCKVAIYQPVNASAIEPVNETTWDILKVESQKVHPELFDNQHIRFVYSKQIQLDLRSNESNAYAKVTCVGMNRSETSRGLIDDKGNLSDLEIVKKALGSLVNIYIPEKNIPLLKAESQP